MFEFEKMTSEWLDCYIVWHFDQTAILSDLRILIDWTTRRTENWTLNSFCLYAFITAVNNWSVKGEPCWMVSILVNCNFDVIFTMFVSIVVLKSPLTDHVKLSSTFPIYHRCCESCLSDIIQFKQIVNKFTRISIVLVSLGQITLAVSHDML